MTRREFLAVSAALAPAQSRRRPNVILIMTDDHGVGDFSRAGNPHIATPNIDRFASQSVEFTRFTVSSVCAPTRASLLTGRYNLRCGVHGVTKGRETMRRNETTLGKALQGAGYRTSLIGKWHLGENYPYVPHAMGFDEFFGFRTGNWLQYFDPPLERNGKALEAKGYISDVFTDEALAFIERNRRRPFFLYLAFNAPHSPYIVPDKYFEKYSGKGLDVVTATIYAMVENIDANLGRLFSKLDEWQLSEDTIVIFLCDNGAQTQRFNAGLRGRKASIFEGGTRSAFFVRWPKSFRGGRKTSRIAAHIDVYPTVLELCGLTPPRALPIEGVSLVPLLQGREDGWPERIIFSSASHQPNPLNRWPGCARSQRFKMVNGTELYDLEADPGEETNVAARHPKELDRLNDAYVRWFESVTTGFTVGHPPIPVGYWEENPAVLTAPQADFSGGIDFFGKNGFAHDFLTGWTSLDAKVSWRITAAAAGRYEVTLLYLCPEGDTGSRIRVSAAGSALEAVVDNPTRMDPIPIEERDNGRYHLNVRHWGRLTAGVVTLPAGESVLEIQALSKKGAEVMQLAKVLLRRL